MIAFIKIYYHTCVIRINQLIDDVSFKRRSVIYRGLVVLPAVYCALFNIRSITRPCLYAIIQRKYSLLPCPQTQCTTHWEWCKPLYGWLLIQHKALITSRIASYPTWLGRFVDLLKSTDVITVQNQRKLLHITQDVHKKTSASEWLDCMIINYVLERSHPKV